MSTRWFKKTVQVRSAGIHTCVSFITCFCDSSLLHGSGASLIHGRFGTVASVCRKCSNSRFIRPRQRQASPVGQDLSELRSIVDIRVMEKIPIFDGNEAHFAEWRFTFEATCGRLGLEEVLRQSVSSTHDEASINVFAQQPEVSLKNKAVYYLLVASCRGRAQVLVRGVPKHAGLVAWRQMVRLYEPQVGSRLNAMLVWSSLSLLYGGKETRISLKKTSLLGTLGSRNTNETVGRWSILRFGWQ